MDFMRLSSLFPCSPMGTRYPYHFKYAKCPYQDLCTIWVVWPWRYFQGHRCHFWSKVGGNTSNIAYQSCAFWPLGRVFHMSKMWHCMTDATKNSFVTAQDLLVQRQQILQVVYSTLLLPRLLHDMCMTLAILLKFDWYTIPPPHHSW